jgi:hypothetical protein
MADCGGTHNVDLGDLQVSGGESEEAARAELRKVAASYPRSINTPSKLCTGDCTGTRKCTPTWDPKDLDTIIAGAKIKEYEDDDGDTAFSATIPKGTILKVTCDCVFKAKKGKGKEKGKGKSKTKGKTKGK